MSEKERCEEARAAFEKRGHKATLVTDTPDVTVIDWRKAKGGSDYYVRYILSRTDHRQNLIVTGDLGDAVFEFFWNRENITIDGFAKMVPDAVTDYLSGKMKTSNGKYDYSWKGAHDEITVELRESTYLSEEEIDEVVEEVMDDYNDGFGSKAYDVMTDHIQDCWEWLDRCGRTLSNRYYLWIVGLVMACNQLKSEN